MSHFDLKNNYHPEHPKKQYKHILFHKKENYISDKKLIELKKYKMFTNHIIEDIEFLIKENKTPELTQLQAIIDKYKHKPVIPREQLITFVVCQYFGVTIDEVQSTKRNRINGKDVMTPRQFICYFIMNEHNLTNEKCGKIISRNHATVIHSVKTVNNLIETDKRFLGYYDDIKKLLVTL